MLRTAARAAWRTRRLAREEAHVLALLGTGSRPVSPAGDSGCATHHARFCLGSFVREGGGIRDAALPRRRPVRRSPNARMAVEQADIVCTVTSSPTPVLEGRWLKPGTHLNLVGAFTPTTREADTEAIRRRLLREMREFGLARSRRAVVPIAQGELGADDVAGAWGRSWRARSQAGPGPKKLPPTSHWEMLRRTLRRCVRIPAGGKREGPGNDPGRRTSAGRAARSEPACPRLRSPLPFRALLAERPAARPRVAVPGVLGARLDAWAPVRRD